VWRTVAARHLSDGGAVVLAIATAAGALVGARAATAWPAVVAWVTLVAAAGALAARQPLVLVAASGLAACALAGGAVGGARPADPSRVDADAVLVSDPVTAFGAVQADARLDGHHVELSARGAPGRALRDLLAGERVNVSGALVPRPADAEWMLERHLVGRLDVSRLVLVDEGDPASQAANDVRRVLARGAAVLPTDQQALFGGFVLGDDRDERAAVIDDFRGSGLSHLLAVSGENVAFVLAVVRPLLTRVGLGARAVAVIAVLGFFALVTRFEPSVLRAVGMAMIATLAGAWGRPISPVRTLALAVAALVLVDPLLVWSIGFQLSIAASLGIALLVEPLGERMPGPTWLAEPMAVTVAAQLAVAPVLLLTFGPSPVAGIPANLLAEPAAGPVMMWGLTAGLVAGLVAGVAPGLAVVIHLPTRVALWWVASVAQRCAALPLGVIGWWALAGIAACGALWLAPEWWPAVRPRMSRAGLVGVIVVLAAAALGRPADHTPVVALGAGVTLWQAAPGADGAVLVVDGRAQVGAVLDGVRRVGRRTVDVLVVRTTGRGVDASASELVDRLAPDLVLAPAGSTVPGAVALTAPERVAVPGGLVIVVESPRAGGSPSVRVEVPAGTDAGTVPQQTVVSIPTESAIGGRDPPARARTSAARWHATEGSGREEPGKPRCSVATVSASPTVPAPTGATGDAREAIGAVEGPMTDRGESWASVWAGRVPTPAGCTELHLGPHRFDIEHRAVVMGILNRTPDSFYDKGTYFAFDDFLRKAEELVADGADFLDVGGVKAGPGDFVDEQQELDRVVPAIEALRTRFDLPLSVDTWRASVAQACFDAGAVVGNDISGFADADYLSVAAAAGASVVATHIRLAPRVPDPDPHYDDVVVDVVDFLRDRAHRALDAGIPRERIMVDAGLDLGKSEPQSLVLLRASDALTTLGFPVFLSSSNKRFLWHLLDVDVGHAGNGTVAAHALGIALGCRILRSHDVRAARRVSDTMAAVLGAA
jgi:dihydropteroate synthase